MTTARDIIEETTITNMATPTYDMTAEYKGKTYLAKTANGNDPEHFNDAVESIAKQLPKGKPGAIVDLSDGGCNGGSLQWEKNETIWQWQYYSYDSDGRQSGAILLW